MSRYYIDAEELLAWYDDIRKHEREILSENYHKERKDEARIKISTLDKVYFKVQELKVKAAEDMVVAALEKQIPKKPIPCSPNSTWTKCPVCGATDIDEYCGKCGQRLDWNADGKE